MISKLSSISLSILLVGALGSTAVFAQEAQTPTAYCANVEMGGEPQNLSFTQPEEMLVENVDYRAIFCTDAGAVYIDLFEDYAPITVNNFIFLAQQGYYDNTIFHRVIEDFMAQGGDPTGTGTGGPGYQFQDEFVGFLTFNQPGYLAMANAGAGTNGSQFFITTVPTPHLDFAHTIFGQVLEGQDNVESIIIRDPSSGIEATRLETVIIVDDPALVETTYVAPEPATAEDFQAVIDLIGTEVPAPLGLNPETTGIFDAEVVSVRAPEALQVQYEELLATNGFQFRAEVEVINTECGFDMVNYTSLHYTVDVFDSADSAFAVLNDPFYTELNGALGLTTPDDPATSDSFYSESVTACDGSTALEHSVMRWQRGQYVITAQATYQPIEGVEAGTWLTELVGNDIFENYFGAQLRTQLP